NAPVNAAVMRQMQRVYGNQATTRFLQARREGKSVGQSLQHTHPVRGGQPPAVDRAVQRFLHAQAERQVTATSAPSSSPSPTPTHEATQAAPAPERQATVQGEGHIQREQAEIPPAQDIQTAQRARHARTIPRIQRANGQPVPVQRGLWDAAAKWALEKAAKAVGGDRLWSLLERAGAALGGIISDPGRFLGNLIAGVKGGFERFSQNIGSHLQRGLKDWLFGQLGKTNLQVPDALDAAGIFSLVMQVLGLTADRIREKLVKLVGAKEVQLIDKAWKGLQTLLTKGIGGLWEEMKEHLSDLKDVVMEEIKGWVITKVIQAAVIKIISMFNPASGLLAVIQMVWKVVQFVMERMSQLAALGQAVLDSVSAIASGNVGGVMSKIEDVLSRSLSVVIGLLANLVGLGGIGQKIREIINKVRTKVEGALDKALKKIVEKVRSTLKRIRGGGQGDANQQAGGQPQGAKIALPDTQVRKTFSLSSEGHTLTARTQGGKLEILMASQEGRIQDMLRKAIAEVSSSSRPAAEKDSILFILRAAKEAATEKDIRADWHAKGARDPRGGTGTLDFAPFMEIRLAQIVEQLKGLSKFDIHDLNDFYTQIPERRYLPADYDVRAKLYERGSSWDSVKKQVVAEEKPKIRDSVRAAIQSNRQDMLDQLIREEKIPKGSTLTSFKVSDVDTVAYHVDHIRALSLHWQLDGGNKGADDPRWQATVKRSNLRMITEEANLAKGSKGEAGERGRFIPFVEAGFTSTYAEGGMQGARTIDGQRFRDAAGNPIT
ncbi:MAG TPA: hypothetical protein VEX13_12775, partial [Chloroflexia bacterium]|nr:hypothetical protein [Chloroflexia bacterium]